MSLLSIGFSKAFNRMDHHVCLKAHADCSAFTESLSMIGSFLLGRKMRFKVNSTMSEARDVQPARYTTWELFVCCVNKCH